MARSRKRPARTTKTTTPVEQPVEILRPKGDADPVSESFAWATEDARRSLALVQRMVRYPDHCEYEQGGQLYTVSVNRFLAIVRLATLDLFAADTDEDAKAMELGADPGETTAEARRKTLSLLRDHPLFSTIYEKLRESMRLLSSATTVEEFTKVLGPLAPPELAAQMIGAPKVRDRLNAAGEFMDRLSPKRSRGEGGGQMVIMFPPDQEKLVERAHDLMKSIDFQVDGEVSAAVLNVPESE